MNGPAPAATITTVGHGEAAGTPDALRLHLTLRHRAASIGEALAGCASAVDAAVAVARRFTDEDRVASRGLHVGEWRDGTSDSHGFEAQHSLEIVCPDLSRSGELIDALAEAAPRRLRVDHVEPFVMVTTAMAVQARERAFADARAKADELAALAGQRVEHPVSVVEGGFANGPRPMEYAARAAADTSFVPGAATIGATVTVTWAASTR